MMSYNAVVSQHQWATKVHAAANEMTVRPNTFRSFCGKPWQIATGQMFESIAEAMKCQRCAAKVDDQAA